MREVSSHQSKRSYAVMDFLTFLEGCHEAITPKQAEAPKTCIPMSTLTAPTVFYP